MPTPLGKTRVVDDPSTAVAEVHIDSTHSHTLGELKYVSTTDRGRRVRHTTALSLSCHHLSFGLTRSLSRSSCKAVLQLAPSPRAERSCRGHPSPTRAAPRHGDVKPLYKRGVAPCHHHLLGLSLRLQAMQVVRGALRMPSSLEDQSFVVLERCQPAGQVSRMIWPGLIGNAKIST
jgi:hypothetical protein